MRKDRFTFFLRFPEALWAVLPLLILPILFFIKPLVLGEVSTPTDNLFSYLPWAPFAPPGYSGPSNYLLFDQVFNFSPWHRYASESILHGRFPLWNPYGACGVPFFANLSSAVLFPPNLLFYLIVPFPWLLTWIKIGKLVLAGVFMRAFLRELGVGTWPALLGAISFAYSGFMIVWLGHAHTNVALCLPLVFLAVEKIIRQSDKIMRGAALLSLAVGIQFLGGHIETSVHLLLGAACYLAFRLGWEGRQKNWMRVLAFVTLAIILGTALASVQLIPFVEYLQEGSVLAARKSGITTQSVLSPRSLFQWLAPNLYGTPLARNDYSRDLGLAMNYVEQTGYIGILPLMLAIAAIIFRMHQPGVRSLLAVGLLGLGVAYGAPILSGIAQIIPVIRWGNNARFILLATFSFSALSGLGAEALFAQRTKPRPSVLRWVWCMAIFVMIMGAVLLLEVQGGGRSARILTEAGVAAFAMKQVIWFITIGLVGAAIIWIVSARKLFKGTWRSLSAPIMVAFVVVDLFSQWMGFQTSVRPEYVYPVTPAIQYLQSQSGLFRIVGLGHLLPADTSMIYGLYDMRGQDPITIGRFEELLTGRMGDPLFLFWLYELPNLLEPLNIRYVVVPVSVIPPATGDDRFKEVYRNEVAIFENRKALPRAWVVHKAREIPDPVEARQYLLGRSFKPAEEVVLSGQSPEPFMPPPGSAGKVQIDRYEPSKVKITVSLPTPGYLVLSDSFYPGWRATDNGAPVEIRRANYAFRAVFLTAGEHRVEFRYQPASVRWGIAISLLAAIGIAVLWRPFRYGVKSSLKICAR